MYELPELSQVLRHTCSPKIAITNLCPAEDYNNIVIDRLKISVQSNNETEPAVFHKCKQSDNSAGIEGSSTSIHPYFLLPYFMKEAQWNAQCLHNYSFR